MKQEKPENYAVNYNKKLTKGFFVYLFMHTVNVLFLIVW